MTVKTAINTRGYRLTSIDFLRGLVIVIMAIDHVRDFFLTGGIADPMAQPDVPIFLYLTRWVTHFCAPVFVFLAGTSIGLMSARKSKSELGSFLLKRGLWLIFVEVAIINFIVTFADLHFLGLPGYSVVLQVIWAIGASMVLLAGFQYLGPKTGLILGVIIIVCHQLLDMVWPIIDGIGPAWVALYRQSVFVVGAIAFRSLYPLIPWVGVMLLGFGSSHIFTKPEKERRVYLIKTGLIMVGSFILLRSIDYYGEPNHWYSQPFGIRSTILDFMNLTKYPPSLLFIMATLGPMAILCAYADKWKGWVKDTLVMFGRVPFFFYVLHFALIHFLSLLFGVSQGFEAKQFLTFFGKYPEGYGTGLGGVYLVWGIVLVIMYPLCLWMAKIKKNRKDWWLSYL